MPKSRIERYFASCLSTAEEAVGVRFAVALALGLRVPDFFAAFFVAMSDSDAAGGNEGITKICIS